MSDNDEIKPGDRFERVGPGGWGVNHGDVVTALRPAGNGYNGWFVRGSNTIMYLGNPAFWQRLPRTDAFAEMKAEEITVDRVVEGLVMGWLTEQSAARALGLPENPPALPESPKAEAVKFPLYCHPCRELGTACQKHAEVAVAPPPQRCCDNCGWAGDDCVCKPIPARCAPGCTPKEPCLTEGVCPGWKEDAELHSAGSSDCPCAQCVWFRAQRGISADALPPARASTYQPRCAGLSGWGSWNGRARK